MKDSKSNGGGWIVITVAWGLAVAIAVYAVGRVSGAHINPAVTLALASIGEFPWVQVPGYIAAQITGGFLGGFIVFLHHFPHWRITEEADLKLAAFSTAPAVRHAPANFASEFIGTFMLIFGILGIGANAGMMADSGGIHG